MATLGKPQRQHRILRILEEQPVSSQGQLVALLEAEGVVSSPATVPRTPGTPKRSIALATTWALPGGVRSTTRLWLWATSTTNSPISRRRWSSRPPGLRSLVYSGIA